MRGIICVVAAVICCAACSRQQGGNQDFVSFEVARNTVAPADVQPDADAHCAKWGKRAVLADDAGSSITFNCVARAAP